VIASTCATVLLVAYVWRRRQELWRRQFSRDDQLILLFVFVLAANAAISYPYTKDVIMSPAGVFFAVAVAVAARHVLPERVALERRSLAAVGLCAVLATTWGIRSLGLHLSLREAGRTVRNQWVYAEEWASRQNVNIADARARELLRALQHDAIFTRPDRPSPRLADYAIFDVH
jgi:hypothetical protein